MKIQINFEKQHLVFDEPDNIVCCCKLEEIKGCFEQLEDYLCQGYYAAGFLSYEAGYAFEEQLFCDDAFDFPLFYFGIYRSPKNGPLPNESCSAKPISTIKRNLTEEEYADKIDTIRNHIAAGDVYQITYCLKELFNYPGPALPLYQKLLKVQPVPYPAYISTNDFDILSLSPELFLNKRGNHILTKPMKGTWPRGSNCFNDLIENFRFKFDKKNRAENIMIADLLRNDLGRIASHIRAPKLYETSPYKTLFQMTSTVTAKIDPNISLYHLFKAVFPSGSVTGAPRIRAMQIIKQIETSPRRIYTGAIGYITPNKDLFFNIPIRTILIRGGQAEMGIGGGIVWDSTAKGEWFESQLKSRFLSQR